MASVLVSKGETAVERSARMALILSLAILAAAGVYFGALYLIAH